MTFIRTPEELTAFISVKISEEDGHIFMGHPDRWYEPPGPKWRCRNDHVSSHYLRTGPFGPVCLGCPPTGRSQLWLTFPEDKDGPIDV